MATTFLTVNQFVEKQPAFTVNSIRALIFNGEKNGLFSSGAIQRIGRRILVNEEKFISWIESGASA